MRDALEAAFRERLDHALAADLGSDHLREACAACWREADAAEDAWASAIETVPTASGDDYGDNWVRLNRLAMLDLGPRKGDSGS